MAFLLVAQSGLLHQGQDVGAEEFEIVDTGGRLSRA